MRFVRNALRVSSAGGGPGRQGSILILSLWSLLLLTVFAVQLSVIVRQKITLVRRIDDRDRRYHIAQAGVRRAIVQLRKEDAVFEADFLGEGWNDRPDVFSEIPVGDGHFTVSYTAVDGQQSRTFFGLEDESSKLNLNKSGVEEIVALLEFTAGLSHFEAEELAYCIMDWRDKDSFFQHPQWGAEDQDYMGLKNSYEAKDGDFEVMEELMLIKKMNQETFDKLRQFVTIYGDGKVNINTASWEVLLALGLTSRAAEDILNFRKGGDGISGTVDDNIFLQTSTIVPRVTQVFNLAPSDVSALSNLVAAGKFSTASNHFRIHSVGVLDHLKGATEILAIVERTGKIVYWQENI